ARGPRSDYEHERWTRVKISDWWTIGLLATFLAAATPSPCLALNESTHRLVNREAGISSKLDDTLRSNLAIKQGVLTRFRDRNEVQKDVLDWLGEGGIQEDQGSVFQFLVRKARYGRHFHDPLQPWDTAGLSVPIPGQFESSIRWMQRADQDTEAVGG